MRDPWRRLLATQLLEEDEDALNLLRELQIPWEKRNEFIGEINRRTRVGQTGEFWRYSFRLDPRMARSLGLPEDRPPGSGSVVHLGTIPPEKIEVLEVRPVPAWPDPEPRLSAAWPRVAAERERILNLLREIRARRKRVPWWLD